MNTTPETGSHSTMSRTWPVIILSEDFATGRQVGARLQREWSARLRDTRSHAQVWRFSSLNHPWLCRLAALQASRGSLVVLCAPPGRRLPPGVKRFLGDWVALSDDHASALLVLSDGDSSPQGRGLVGAVSGTDGRTRIPVYDNVGDAVSAAGELVRWRSPDRAPQVGLDHLPSTDARWPDGQLVL